MPRHWLEDLNYVRVVYLNVGEVKVLSHYVQPNEDVNGGYAMV